MKKQKLICSLLISMLVMSCSTARFKYESEVSSSGKTEAYTFEKSYSTSNDALLCAITGILYGGWCWTYLFMPNSSQKDTVKNDAWKKLDELFGKNKYQTSSEKISHVSWDKEFEKYSIGGKQASSQQLASAKASDAVALRAAGCKEGDKFKLTKPAHYSNLTYENTDVKIKFGFLDINRSELIISIPKDAFVVELENKTNRPQKIVWSESVFIDYEKQSKKIIPSGRKFIQSNEAAPDSIVAGKSKLSEQIIPSENIVYDNGWKIYPYNFFKPENRFKKFGLLLTVETNGKRIAKEFEFTICNNESTPISSAL